MSSFMLDAALVGGIFWFLTFWHFVSDWIFQTHSEAMVKHTDALVRAKHCLIYTFLMMIPILPMVTSLDVTFMTQSMSVGLIAAVLLISHFVEDTYVPVFLWAKHIRRPPLMGPDLSDEMNIRGFKAFIDTTLGKILMIVVDQIIHIAFLFLIAIFLVAVM